MDGPMGVRYALGAACARAPEADRVSTRTASDLGTNRVIAFLLRGLRQVRPRGAARIAGASRHGGRAAASWQRGRARASVRTGTLRGARWRGPERGRWRWRGARLERYVLAADLVAQAGARNMLEDSSSRNESH